MTVSKAEKAAIALGAAFVLFFTGWYARGSARDGWYQVSTQEAVPRQTAAPSRTTFVPDTLLDLNAASLADLTGLPGIGPAKAQAILDYREEHGPFRRIEDLMRVSGIGEGTFQQLEPYITVTIPEGGQTP